MDAVKLVVSIKEEISRNPALKSVLYFNRFHLLVSCVFSPIANYKEMTTIVSKSRRKMKKNNENQFTMQSKEAKMKFTEKDHNYIESDEERNEGHVDTRYKNFECNQPDPSLGCDMGIDVQG